MNLNKHWTSNTRLLSTGFVMLNQSTMQPYHALYWGPVHQNDTATPKSTNELKNMFTNLFYTILRLCSTQKLITVSNYINMCASRTTVRSKVVIVSSVRELHNIMVSTPEQGGPKESIESEDNIIISDSNLRNILLPQIKNIIA